MSIEILLCSFFKQYCCSTILKFVNRFEGLSCGIWLFALFLSAIGKTSPLLRVSIIYIGSIG